MRSLPALVLPILLAAQLGAPGRAQRITTPEEYLGRPVGGDFTLADWGEVSGYHRRLASQSPRVISERVGTTTEERPFLLTTIADEAGLAALDRHRALAALLADPRGASEARKREAVETARPILFISLGMHSSETSPPQFGMELAHRLATSEEEPYRSARERLIVCLIPCTNPDGLDRVVEWYRETVATPHESSRPLELYQHYTGHDNNRDWFALTQSETRIVTRLLYSEWFPQVYWDVHEQGSSRERFFVPPFRDPLDPNLDPAIIAGIDALGSRALYDMTRENLAGISTGVSYDMWWNGGNRNVPVRHNIIGLLTEAAGVRYGSPVFLPRERLGAPRGLEGYAPSNRFPLPWPGGWWRLRDVIDYEHAFARSLLASLAREPQTWLRGALEASQRAIEEGARGAPRTWVIPSDNPDRGAVRRLVEILLLSGVEVHAAERELEADGRTWPAGSLVIFRDQPYGSYVKDLFEVQRYPGGDQPYDVAGWTLPHLFGVHRVEVMERVSVPLRRVVTAGDGLLGFAARGESGLLSSDDSDTWKTAFAELRGGRRLSFLEEGAGAGSFVLGAREAPALALERMPRLGVYAPWSGSMDEGWLRWVLDAYEIPFTRVRNEMVRAGRLGELLDVLVIPSIRSSTLDQGRPQDTVPPRYEGGLDPEGAVAIEEFVRRGGTLVTIGRSSAWAVDLLELPLIDVTREPASEGFSCPGSVLRGVPREDRLTRGLPDSLALFFSSSSAWRIEPEAEPGGPTALLALAPTRILLSGRIERPEVVEDRAVWVRAEHGRGRVHLFGFSPHFRAWSQQTFQLLFRAVLLDGS